MVASDNHKKNRRNNVSRRRLLKSAGASGVALAGIKSTPTVLGKSENEVEIVITKEGDCIGETRKVNQQWYEHTKSARQVKRGLSDLRDRKEDIHSIGLGKGRRKIDGLFSHQVEISIVPDGDTDGIPQEVDGIPVVIERRPRSIPTCYTDSPDSIPGGVGYKCPETNGTATLCCRVKDYRNGAWRKYMLGVRHNHMSNGNHCQDEDASKTTWNQFSRDAGTVVEGFQNHDAVLLKLTNSNRDINSDIVDESGAVSGRVTKDGLDCLKSSNETVHKRGITTCRTSGTIEKTQQEIFCWDGDYIGGVVRSTCRQESGDSGGPVYYKTGSSLYLVNIATHRPGDGSYDAQGSSANSMNENQGFWFGGDPYSC